MSEDSLLNQTSENRLPGRRRDVRITWVSSLRSATPKDGQIGIGQQQSWKPANLLLPLGQKKTRASCKGSFPRRRPALAIGRRQDWGGKYCVAIGRRGLHVSRDHGGGMGCSACAANARNADCDGTNGNWSPGRGTRGIAELSRAVLTLKDNDGPERAGRSH